MCEIIKPCPFCGHIARIQTSEGFYWVKCPTCKSESAPKKNVRDALKLWNKRVKLRTVEDVLREYAAEVALLGRENVNTSAYAAELQMRGDE